MGPHPQAEAAEPEPDWPLDGGFGAAFRTPTGLVVFRC